MLKKLINNLWLLNHGQAHLKLQQIVLDNDNIEPSFVADAPNKKLTLNFVNGFKVEDSRQNMFWSKNSD